MIIHPSEAAFLAFAQTIDPEVYAAITAAEPLSPIFGYRRTENRRRHYEELLPPDRLIVLGDAVCGFNPIYGQGMTVAVVTALALGKTLTQARQLEGVAARFQRQVPEPVAPAWLLATGADFEWIWRGPPPNICWTISPAGICPEHWPRCRRIVRSTVRSPRCNISSKGRAHSLRPDPSAAPLDLAQQMIRFMALLSNG